MPYTFWTNTIWYALLGIAALIQFILVLRKATDKKHTISLFVIVSGMLFTIEVIIYCFLRVYDYYPMIFPDSPINDGLAGNLFSQFTLTATALFISAFTQKYRWVFIFSGMYFTIEELFLMIGIYSHNFWSSWVTFFSILLFFTVTKQLYNRKTIFTNNFKLRMFFMFIGLYTLHMPTALWIQILTGIMQPNLEFFQNEMRSYAFICLLNLLLISLVCLFVYYSKIDRSLKVLITLSLYSLLYLADQLNFIFIKDGWFFIFSTINIFAMYIYIAILDKLLHLKESHSSL